MTNTVLIKRSSTPGAVPTSGDLVAGELAINYADGKLYFLGAGNAVTQIAGNSTMSYSGNVTGGNLLTGGIVSATGNITGGNLLTAGTLTVTGNIISVANISGGNITTAGLLSAAGNVTGGNLITAGQISATGNITGNYYIGNGALLTGISAGTADRIANGATNISIPVASGNIAMNVGGASNTVVINLGSLTMYGTFAGPKNLSANVSVANAVNALLLGPVTIQEGYNITVPDASTLYVYTP